MKQQPTRMRITPINESFAAEFFGVDLAQPVSDGAVAAIEGGMDGLLHDLFKTAR
jgi:hypothetical protein